MLRMLLKIAHPQFWATDSGAMMVLPCWHDAGVVRPGAAVIWPTSVGTQFSGMSSLVIEGKF